MDSGRSSAGHVLALAALSWATAAAPPPARAQTAPPDTLRWEYVGDVDRICRLDLPCRLNVEGLFVSDTAAYATGGRSDSLGRVDSGVFVLRPGEADWTLTETGPGNHTNGNDVTALPSGHIFVNNAFLERSTDEGRTWEVLRNGTDGGPLNATSTVYPTPAGHLIVGEGRCCGVAPSTDGGAMWMAVDTEPDLGFGLVAYDFATLPPAGEWPAGRLVGGGAGGLMYSGDDGRSWRGTNLTQDFTYIARSVERGANGLLYSAVNGPVDGGWGYGAVYESSDGAAWTHVGTIPLDYIPGFQLVATPDTALYAIAAGLMHRTLGRPPEVYRSTDRGRTWASVGPVWTAWPIETNELAAAPDGRLWLAAGDGDPVGGYGGVFRTVEPVFTVAAEPPPSPGERGLLLDVRPNPAGRSAVVTLTLPAPAEVRLAAYDALGREIALLHEGPLPAGSRVFSWDASGFAPGLYVVRATTAQASQTARLTLR